MRKVDFSELLQEGDFGTLFREGMGWDNPTNPERVVVEDSNLRPVPIAEKRGVTAWLIDCPSELPNRAVQTRVTRALKRRSRDQLVLFKTSSEHCWQWPEQRSSGAGFRLVDHKYPTSRPSEALIQRLKQATFTFEEELSLTSSEVLDRVRRSFNAEKVTKSFFREFQKHHKNFANQIEGLESEEDCRWYASVLLNRLMFIYFIQRKGFLDNEWRYLRDRLGKVREHFYRDRRYAFYSQFLLPLFHEALGNPKPAYDEPQIKELIGDVPYVNGGIFERHDLERNNLSIKDDAFESLFDFFDEWKWHLDDNPKGDENEINPDILGFIFEQYINFTEKGQKEKGAYYTKPDVTGYMAASTILPAIADRLVEAGLDNPAVLLGNSRNDYIHDSIMHGVGKSLPEDWKASGSEPSGDFALPGERWCEVTHRRGRYEHLNQMLTDPVREWSIDDAITENLDLRELLADYMTQLASPDECDKAFQVLRSLSVCDPTVGSGAFLFAALEVLQPLYEIVLERAAELVERGKGMADCLKQARTHHSVRYWTLKTLCLNNLYGVDLMREAPEIAKLRLFLKLVAQLYDVENLEPLPDLDFNIKSGNLLVGIADGQDALERLADGRFDFGGEIEEIQALAKEVASHQKRFVVLQSSDVGAVDHSKAKEDLSVQLDFARGKSDQLLYRLRNEKRTFADWRDTHQPFHWFVEFPSVWAKGGFDVVIGNPPYIKKSEVKDYTWTGFKTESCPDLYALCLERASNLVNTAGRFSKIVMLSLCFNRQFLALRKRLTELFESLWISSYDQRPDGLFSGSSAVHNTIVLGKYGGGGGGGISPSLILPKVVCKRSIGTVQCHQVY